MTTTSATKWAIDQSHSEVQFKIKHLVISTVTGSFKNFSGWVEAGDDQFTNAKAYFEADINSVDTGSEQRDGHLKSDDFFNAEQFPRLVFRSGSFSKTGDNTYEMTGELTIRDITKEVKLDVEFGGIMTDPWGNTKAGFEINGRINRQDFGLKWGAVTEAGGVVVSDEVKIHCNIQVAKQA